MRKLLTFLFTVFLLNFALKAQVVNPIKWEQGTKKINEQEYELIITATIDKGWHMYSQNFPAGGPVPMTFIFPKSSDYKRVGKFLELTKPHKEYDDIFEINVQYFKDKAVFSQKVKMLSKKPFVINFSAEYQVCFDDKCVLFNPDFEFKLPGAKNTSTGAVTPAKTNENETKTAETSTENTKLETVKKETKKEKIAATPKTSSTTKEGEDVSILTFFFMAFAGGLVALLTPCIYPMIPMTVSFFMNSGENKSKAKREAIFYGISIVAIYTGIGSVVSATMGPSFVNWLSTHWLPNIFFFAIFIVFAASFFGMFEIVLPSSWISKTDAKADKGGYFGAFFMAFTLVLVSFSCTAPIVGTVLIEAAVGEVVKPVVGMLGFSLAFALPFTFFAFFPSKLSSLPKSGGWLNSVKVVLGFIELALALKFLSVADQTYHWGLLDREVYLALWIVIFALMGFYLLGKLKFSHDSELKFVSVPRLVLSIASFAFCVYMIPGLFGAPLKALAGYLPPQTTQDFDIAEIVRNNAGNDNSESLCEEPIKFADNMKLPFGIKGYFDYEQALRCAKEKNKPVFIDFTGHGCVNCREMENRVWSEPDVLKRLKKDYIIAALYVDDKTELPKEKWTTSTFDGKVKKTVGKINGDFQITRFNANAQPYYVLINPDGEMLVQPRGYNLDAKEFVNFLDKGKENMKKGKNVTVNR